MPYIPCEMLINNNTTIILIYIYMEVLPVTEVINHIYIHLPRVEGLRVK